MVAVVMGTHRWYWIVVWIAGDFNVEVNDDAVKREVSRIQPYL